MEIFELYFCELDKCIKTSLIERERKDRKSIELLDGEGKNEDKNDEVEDAIY